LTATTPIEAEWLKTAGYGEMQRIIREEDPPPPSLRVSTMYEQLETVAKNRRIEPRSLSRQFRGDLDWIVMKALEKDRTRRYATAGDLASDIERYLRHEPVEAGPPGAIYRVQKFVRRHRTAAMAGFLVTAALLAGLALATTGFVSASLEARKSQSIAAFLEDIVVAVNPDESAGGQLDAERVMQRARKLFGNDHATVAAALDSLALRAQHTGDFAAAERLFRESSRIWRMYGANTPSLALTLGHLGTLLRLKGDDTGAEAALRESLAISAALPDSHQLAFCETRSELATVLQRTGHLDEAGDLVRESLRVYRMQPKQPQYRIAKSLELLTAILSSQNRTDDAEAAFTEAISLYRELVPPDSPMAAFYNFALGHWLRQHGKLEKAAPYLREAVRIYRRLENPPREFYLAAVDGLFQHVRWKEESLDEALVLFHECMQNMARVFGADHPSLGAHFLGYGQLLGERNRDLEAISLLVEGLRISSSTKGGESDPGAFIELLNRYVRRVACRADATPADYETALTGAAALQRDNASDARYHHLRGMVLYRLGRVDDALAELTVPDDSANGGSRDWLLTRLAFLALAQHRAGNPDAARTTLPEMQNLRDAKDEKLGTDTLSVMAETERVVGDSK
jgi:tetratricopeptide (TPR) repeat protein